MKKLLLTVACTMLACASGVSARASASVLDTLEFSIGEPAPAFVSGTIHQPVPSVVFATCRVTVPAGSNGIVLLNAAVASGCINSYDTVQDPTFGDFLLAVDHIRGAHEAVDATYWRLSVDDQPASTGLDGFHATNGQVYGFSFTTWLAGPVIGY